MAGFFGPRCNLTAPPPRAPPPPPPPKTPPPPPDDDEACGYPEFLAHSREVTAACCDEASESCDGPTGIPTTCGAACAAVLLPMQRECADFLATIGLLDTVDAVAAECPAPPPPPPPCEAYPEFLRLSQAVSAACCAAPTAACA
eukprot:SAG11_NODE_11165_length_779_cov_2.610294_1_plen_143_part_01